MNRLRFSLRSILFFVAIIAAFCGGWTASEVHRERQGNQIVDRISAEIEDRVGPILNDLRIVADKSARGSAPLSATSTSRIE